MKKYSEYEKSRILAYPIEMLLRHFNKRTEHTRSGMYYSPLREEDTPSFFINYSENLWMDFGLGEGGNALNLVSRLAGISLSKSWEYIASLDFSIGYNHTEVTPAAKKRQASKIIIDKVYDEFTLKTLVGYAQSRGIPREILESYCRQIAYHISTRREKKLTAIGFRTTDGWVLRHTSQGAYSKRCTGSSCSFISGNGEINQEPVSESVEIFEGFFDFLSWMVLTEKILPESDICVLNSVSNIGRAIRYISYHKRISCWTDNDTAGEKAYETILGCCPGATSNIETLRRYGCNDVNDLLLFSIKHNEHINL